MSSQSLIEQVRASARVHPPRLARAIREAAGLSQTQVAQEVGVSTMTISRWESGETKPHGDAAARYASVLTDIQREVGRP